jgi:hypothetical protein
MRQPIQWRCRSRHLNSDCLCDDGVAERMEQTPEQSGDFLSASFVIQNSACETMGEAIDARRRNADRHY